MRVAEVIQWQNSWLIGIAFIDEQHRKLVHALADLQRKLEAKASRTSSLDALALLTDYVELHLDDEEFLMRQIGFPKLDEHCEEHRQFRDRVRALSQEFRLGETEIGQEVARFLSNWVTLHVAGSDLEIAKFIETEHLVLPGSLTMNVSVPT